MPEVRCLLLSPALMLLNIIFVIAATPFLIISLRALLCMRWAQRLPALDKSASSRPSARVSVVFAARDEEERVTETLRHLLAQEEVELEIIPVDDRSRDRTGQILKYFAAEDSRVRPRRVDLLPDGWLGKCYACHLGASTASGEWILFTDADCWLKPDVIARAIMVAERAGVDHITLSPGVAPHTVPAQAWHLAFLITPGRLVSARKLGPPERPPWHRRFQSRQRGNVPPVRRP